MEIKNGFEVGVHMYWVTPDGELKREYACSHTWEDDQPFVGSVSPTEICGNACRSVLVFYVGTGMDSDGKGTEVFGSVQPEDQQWADWWRTIRTA